LTKTTKTMHTNANVGACRRQWTTGAVDGASPGAMTTTRTAHAHRYEIHRLEETDVTVKMINMCAVLKKTMR
jgi:uncharacterized protein (DUF1684 family)